MLVLMLRALTEAVRLPESVSGLQHYRSDSFAGFCLLQDRLNCLQEIRHDDRFGSVTVHPGLQTSLGITMNGVSRQSDNR
jgi:hypothetical protein